MKRKNQKIKLGISIFVFVVVISLVGIGISYALKKETNQKNKIFDKKIKNTINHVSEQNNLYEKNSSDNGFFPEIDLKTKDKIYKNNVYIDKKGQAKINKNIVFDILEYINQPKNLSFFSGKIIYDYKFENNDQKITIYLGWKYEGKIQRNTSYTFELLI